MSLIVTQISQFGIIHASDSKLTETRSGKDIDAGSVRKVFPIPYLDSGLSIAGSFTIGGQPLEEWIKDFIENQKKEKTLLLSDFANRLRDELQYRMLPQEKHDGSIIHIAGYVQSGSFRHPEFWFIRNIKKIDESTGEYIGAGEEFTISEDFWNRDCLERDFMKEFKKGTKIYRLYINGMAEARISFNILQDDILAFLRKVWANSNWKFRPPNSLDEMLILIELYMEVITKMFRISNYDVFYVGGSIQSYLIPQPANIAPSRSKRSAS